MRRGRHRPSFGPIVHPARARLCRRAMPLMAWCTPSPLRRQSRSIFQDFIRAKTSSMRHGPLCVTCCVPASSRGVPRLCGAGGASPGRCQGSHHRRSSWCCRWPRTAELETTTADSRPGGDPCGSGSTRNTRDTCSSSATSCAGPPRGWTKPTSGSPRCSAFPNCPSSTSAPPCFIEHPDGVHWKTGPRGTTPTAAPSPGCHKQGTRLALPHVLIRQPFCHQK